MLAVVHDAIAAAPTLRPAVIPVTHARWKAALVDAELSEQVTACVDGAVTTVSAADDRDGTRAGHKLQAASNTLAESLTSLLGSLALLSSFEPAATGSIGRIHDAVLRLTSTALSAAHAPEPGSLDATPIDAILADTHELGSFVEDPVDAVLGISITELRDEDGVFSSARLLGAYRGRYGDLQHRLHTLLRAVTDDPPALLAALHPAEALILTPRPFLTLKAAIAVRDLIEQELVTDPDRLAPLRELKLRVARSAASHVGIVATGHALEQAAGDAERAQLELDLYRRMVEGQLRPWAWTLLQVRGRSDSRSPALGSIRELLLADGHPLFAAIAAAILPVARNAAAHEDYAWDEEKQMLAVGEDHVSVVTLESATERAYSLMCGAECGWACARSSSPKLARLLDAGDPPGHLRPPLDEQAALSHFGTNGLLSRAARLSQGTWTVTLDDLPFRSINPCFQALVWSAQLLRRVERFKVLLPGRDLPVVDIERHVLEANWFVWKQARATMDRMPQSAFLPANAWARLAVELPGAAARSAAWLALNDAVDACEESETRDETAGPIRNLEMIRRRAARLALRLDVIVNAVGATLTVLPADANERLETVLETVEPAAHWASSIAAGHTPGPLPAYIDRLHELHAAWPAVSVLPTLDPTPLDRLSGSA